jgi:hypothetical protein
MLGWKEMRDDLLELARGACLAFGAAWPLSAVLFARVGAGGDAHGWDSGPGDVCRRTGDVYPCADVWGHCILAMLEEDKLPWREVNPRTWIKQMDYFELDFQPSLDAFATQRVTTRSETPASLLRSPRAGMAEPSRGRDHHPNCITGGAEDLMDASNNRLWRSTAFGMNTTFQTIATRLKPLGVPQAATEGATTWMELVSRWLATRHSGGRHGRSRQISARHRAVLGAGHCTVPGSGSRQRP